MRLAMLGTGLMGGPMAVRLARAGHALTVWNRTRAKTNAAAAAGAAVAETPAAAVAGAELVLVILENGPVVAEVLFEAGVAAALAPGTVLVDLSSIPPPAARDHAARLAARGVAALDAPVSGGPPGAEEGSLAIMVGGEEAAFARAEPVLRLLGRPVRVGPAGAGQLAKLCSQVITGAAMGAVAEVMLLARAGGADPDRVREALRGGFADSKVLQLHGARMTGRDFRPGGHVRTFAKDLDAVLHAAAEAGLDLPVARQVRSLFGALQALGGDEHDIAALVLETEHRNPGHRAGEGMDRGP